MAKKTLKPIKLDFNNVMAEAVGKAHGLTAAQIKAFDRRAVQFHKRLLAERKSEKLGFYDLPYQDALVRRIKKTVAQLKNRFENFVVLGIGGSALGNIALQAALNHPYYNLLDKKARNGMPRIFVMDNVDPEYFGGLLDVIDPKKTLFNLISKSGGTAEPMSQFMVVREILKKKLGSKARNHIIATTDKESGILREIVDKEDYESFIIPDNVGGRFSVFTPVGLLSAAMGGIDIAALLAGAATMDKRCGTPALTSNPAYRNAVVHYLADTKKRQGDLGDDALLQRALPNRRLVPAVVGREPGQKIRRQQKDRPRRPDADKGTGRDRPALAGPVVRRRPQRQNFHAGWCGEIPPRD